MENGKLVRYFMGVSSRSDFIDLIEKLNILITQRVIVDEGFLCYCAFFSNSWMC